MLEKFSQIGIPDVLTESVSNTVEVLTLVLHKISSPEAYGAVYKDRWRPRLHGMFTGLSRAAQA